MPVRAQNLGCARGCSIDVSGPGVIYVNFVQTAGCSDKRLKLVTVHHSIPQHVVDSAPHKTHSVCSAHPGTLSTPIVYPLSHNVEFSGRTIGRIACNGPASVPGAEIQAGLAACRRGGGGGGILTCRYPRGSVPHCPPPAGGCRWTRHQR